MTTNEAENEKDPRADAPESAEGDGPDAPESAEGDGPNAPAGEPETSAAPEEAPAADASAEPVPESEPSSASAPAAAEAPKKSPAKAQAQTPGQRLAAARAAKAAKKTAQRGRDADEREKRAIDTAEVVREKATSYLDTHRRLVLGAIGAVVVAASLLFGVRRWQEGQEHAAGALLQEGNRIQLATVRSESERATTDDDEPTYATRAARAEAALRKYRAVTSRYPRTDAAAWAYLGEGRALLDRGEPGEARAAYQKAIDAADGDPAVARQALEGIGFAYEAEENWDEALSTYEELGELANGAFESWGEYHAARMLLKKGDEDGAKTRLRAVLDGLRAVDAPAAPYLRRQVEARLALLDPSLVTQSPSSGGQLSPEQIQELIRQAQARQGQSGETP